ncbi:MAG TPA: DUF4126 domain-containing protein [Acidobacteriaceae bacterium]|jgi:hypothetical protein
MTAFALSPGTIASLVIAVSFAAGLNVYATVATLGILARFHWIDLPGSLGALANPWIIGVSAALFLGELFADKIPGFDLVWNALHTFIRIPAAALMAYAASSHLTPEQQLLVTLAGGAIAAIAHSSKTAARVLVTPSPEPISNIALSSGEDAIAIALTWFATHHPVIAGSVIGVLSLGLVVALWFTFKRIRAALTRSFRSLRDA